MFRSLEAGWLPLAHCSLTFFMTGLIWFVQIVHYPLFAAVGRERFGVYEGEHMRRVSWVVGPVMLAEGATAIALLWCLPANVERDPFLVNFGLLVAIWLSTAVWQVPQHEVLRQGFDAAAANRLVRTNWVRTVCWSARAALLLYCLPEVVAMTAFAPSGMAPR